MLIPRLKKQIDNPPVMTTIIVADFDRKPI